MTRHTISPHPHERQALVTACAIAIVVPLVLLAVRMLGGPSW